MQHEKSKKTKNTVDFRYLLKEAMAEGQPGAKKPLKRKYGPPIHALNTKDKDVGKAAADPIRENIANIIKEEYQKLVEVFVGFGGPGAGEGGISGRTVPDRAPAVTAPTPDLDTVMKRGFASPKELRKISTHDPSTISAIKAEFGTTPKELMSTAPPGEKISAAAQKAGRTAAQTDASKFVTDQTNQAKLDVQANEADQARQIKDAELKADKTAVEPVEEVPAADVGAAAIPKLPGVEELENIDVSPALATDLMRIKGAPAVTPGDVTDILGGEGAATEEKAAEYEQTATPTATHDPEAAKQAAELTDARRAAAKATAAAPKKPLGFFAAMSHVKDMSADEFITAMDTAGSRKELETLYKARSSTVGDMNVADEVTGVYGASPITTAYESSLEKFEDEGINLPPGGYDPGDYNLEDEPPAMKAARKNLKESIDFKTIRENFKRFL